MCCEKLQREINYGRFKKDGGISVVFKSSDYDEDYGYAVFEHIVKIKFCPFCGMKH